jgi:hypothetical protein
MGAIELGYQQSAGCFEKRNDKLVFKLSFNEMFPYLIKFNWECFNLYLTSCMRENQI